MAKYLDETFARLYIPNEGKILIDGYDIQKVELDSLRKQIGIVPQDSLLFRGTIENISLTNSEISEEEIINVAKLANAHDFIMELPNGYSTEVGKGKFSKWWPTPKNHYCKNSIKQTKNSNFR